MKPTVISGGSSDNPHTNPSGNNGSHNVAPDNDNNNTQSYQTRFPHFQPGFGFSGPEVDGIFSEAGFRPRLHRWRDPWNLGARKRCGTNANEDPYSRYFADDSDLFPGFDPEWDDMRGRRRVAPEDQHATNNDEHRSDFFDYIPAEFRHYMPENFGFSNLRAQPKTTAAAGAHAQSYPPHPQQYYEAHDPQQHQPQGHQQQQQQQPKPKYCDASIQTEDDINMADSQARSDPTQNLKQHGLRNTVDLGQKSPQEECRETRAQSAPPNDGNQSFASASASSYAEPGDAQSFSTAYASTGTDPKTPQQTTAPQQPAFNEQRTYNSQANSAPPPPQRKHVPQYQTPPQYQQQQQQPKSPSQDSGFVRHVPIFVEGRSEPVNRNRQQPPQQQKSQPPQPQQHHQPKPTPQEQHRPTPLNTQQANAPPPTADVTDGQVPPQTPHTAQSINKIQAIQRDVLDLMSKVEQFGGAKNDKEYMYLDEMLTRNLLKLDTIDTNGKDSIRLARREAIKCIQASINVLEAKAEENAKTAQESVMEVENTEPENTSTDTPSKEAEEELNKPESDDTNQPQAEVIEPSKDEQVTESAKDEQVSERPKDEQVASTEPKPDSETTQPEAVVEDKAVADTSSTTPSTEKTEESSEKSPEKEPRSKSPKKKIIRKVKKVDKKDKSSDPPPTAEKNPEEDKKTENAASTPTATTEESSTQKEEEKQPASDKQ